MISHIPILMKIMEMPDSKIFADRFRQALEESGISQEKLAEEINRLDPPTDDEKPVTQQNVSYWAREAKSCKKLTVVAKILNVNPDWLSAGKGPKSSFYIASQNDARINSSILKYDIQKEFTLSLTDVIGSLKMDKSTNYAANRFEFDLPTEQVRIGAATPTTRCYKMTGDDFAPTLYDGWAVAVDAALKPQPGEMLIINLKNGKCILGIHLYQKPLSITLQALPSLENKTIELTEIQELWPVICIAMPSQFKLKN